MAFIGPLCSFVTINVNKMKSPLHLYIYIYFPWFFQVNYFPSRFDPARHAEKVPIPSRVLTGCREKVSILDLSVSLCSICCDGYIVGLS